MKPTIHRSVHPVAVASSFARRTTATLLAAAALLPLGTPTVRAATAIGNSWDPGHTGTFPGSGGSGFWDLTTANWVQFPGSDNTYLNMASGGTTFAGTAGTVSLNVSGIVSTFVNLDTAGYVLQDAPGTSYVLAAPNGFNGQNTSGTVTVALPASLSNTFGGSLSVFAGGTLAATGNLTVSGGLNIDETAGGGTVIVSGNNTITGITNVGSGTVQLAATGTNQPLGGTSQVTVQAGSTLLYAAGSSNQIPAGTPLTLNGGTFNVNGQSQDRAHALGALTLSSTESINSELDFSPTLTLSSVLAFANSSAAIWSGTLSVYDYHGTPLVGGGVDQLFFGTNASGLTAAQLADITFYAGGPGSAELGTGIILSDGEVTYTPLTVPEPSTWAAVLGGGAMLLVVQRRRTTRYR